MHVFVSTVFPTMQLPFNSRTATLATNIKVREKNTMHKCTKQSLVEGDFKNLRIRMVLPEDYDKVCEHIAEHYVRGETTCQLLGWSQKMADEVNLGVRMALLHNMSFLAEDRSTGEIAGVRVTLHHTKDLTFDHLDITTRGAKIFFKLCGDIVTLGDIPKRYGIDNWAEFLFASTNPKYRNLGLAGEFYTRSLEFLKAEGFKHASVVVTSPYTKAATKRREFEQVARIDYDKFLDFDGKLVFDPKIVTADHFALCMVKTIQ